MDKNITRSFLTSYSLDKSGKVHESSYNVHRSPSEKTLNFLRMFARNYRASALIPESLPGFMLG